MNPIRTKLEAERAEASRKGTELAQLAQKEQRELTAEERTQVQSHLDEAKRLDARIKGMESDDAILAQLQSLGIETPKGTKEQQARKAGDEGRQQPRSIGEQFVQSLAYQAIARGEHRQRGFNVALEIDAATLTEDSASGGDLIIPQVLPGITPTAQRRIMVTDLITPGTTTSNAIEYLVETTFTNAAAPRVEATGAAAESALIFDRKSSAVQSIDHFLPVTAEMLEDYDQSQSYIDGRLILGLGLAEEDQLLNGNGTPPALRGLMNATGITTAQARGTDTNADAIFKQIMAVASASYLMPDGIVLNPAQWQTLMLAKDGNGQYYGGGPFNPMPQPYLWGLPVAVTPAIAATYALVGSFRAGSQRFVRRGATLSASNSHSDYFTKRLVALMVGLREALVIYRPAALGQVTGLN